MTFPDSVHIERRRLKLIKQGYTGVYVPGECACTLDGFAPCDNEWSVVRDCKPGYKHDVPGGTFFISSSKEPPSQAELDEIATLPLCDDV